MRKDDPAQGKEFVPAPEIQMAFWREQQLNDQGLSQRENGSLSLLFALFAEEEWKTGGGVGVGEEGDRWRVPCLQLSDSGSSNAHLPTDCLSSASEMDRTLLFLCLLSIAL